jgi:hypothetical protein
MGVWWFSCMEYLPRHWMEERGQLHAPSALLPRKVLPVALQRKLCCLHAQYMLWRREKSRPQSATQLRFYAFSVK